MSQKCNLLRRTLQVKEQVSEAVARGLQFLKVPKLHRKISVLESLFNKVASLKACNSIKKRLQYRCFPVRFAKFLRRPFFTEQLQWLLLRFSSCFQRSPREKLMRLSPIHTWFTWKRYLQPWKSWSCHRKCSVKGGLQLNFKKAPVLQHF